MNRIIGTFFLSTLLCFCAHAELVKDWQYYSQEEIAQYRQKEEVKKRKENLTNLQFGKHYILEGNIELAEYYLNQINDGQSQLSIIRDRYLGLIHFIRGDYKKSWDILGQEKFNDTKYYPQVCLLRVVNQLAMNDDKTFVKELTGCLNRTFGMSSTDHLWLNAIGDVRKKKKKLLQGRDIELFRNVITDQEFSKVWFKLGLFINKEELALRYVKDLPPEAYQSKILRELIGILYFRTGNTEKAQSFLEDVDSPNAELVRGNINLTEKKYELAFGHFKLALKKKENSMNALERAIPLAWVLGQWEEGEKLLLGLMKPGLDERKKLALDTAFKIRRNELKEAEAGLNILDVKFKHVVPKEVLQMKSYVALRAGENKKLIDYSSKACLYFDGLNCWLQMQTLLWENLGKTIKRKENTANLENFDIEALKTTAKVTPLRESITIDQRDIEELDSQQVVIEP